MFLQKKILLVSACAFLVSSTLISASFVFSAVTAQAQSRRVRYVPPSNLDAPVVSGAGITRSGGCEESKCFIALIPELEVDKKPAPLTISERPTIYFLVPKIGLGSAKFTIKESHEKLEEQKLVYKAQLVVPENSGIMSFTLPQDGPALKANKNYTWDIYLSGSDDFSATIRGSVRHIKPDLQLAKRLTTGMKPIERATLLAQEGIWFDSVQALVEAQQSSPKDLVIKSEWNELLNSVKLDKALGKAFVGSLTVKPPKPVNPEQIDVTSY